MNVNTLAAGIIGFLLGGLVVSTAASLEDDDSAIGGSLRPGGRVVIWDIDWSTVSWHSTDTARMGRMLAAWDRHPDVI